MLPLVVHWNVDPIMFHIGSFGVRWYSMGFLLAFLLGYYLMAWFFKKEKVRAEYLDSLLIYMFVAILVGARLGHCLFYDADYFFTREHWVEIFWPFQNGHFTGFAGLASHGAAIGVIIALWLYWRRYRINPWWLLDRLVIIIALGGAFIRIGNVFNSEIYGIETSLPWGFIFERNGETVAKHPTGLYEALAYLLIFVGLMIYYVRKEGQFHTGTCLGWWLITLWGARFLIEFLKTNGIVDGASLKMGQILSIPLIIGGIVVLVLAQRGKLPQGPFPQGPAEKIESQWNNKKKKTK